MSTTCGWRFLGQGVQIYEPNIILKPEMISIGDHSRLDSFLKIEGGLGVTIGEYCHVASLCHINPGGGEVIIGAHSGLSSGAKILGGMPDLSFLHVTPCEPPELVHTLRMKTVIGEYVLIASGAIVLPGVTIGDYAIVGAGAVVTHDVEPFTIVAGCPAQKIGNRAVTGLE